MRAQVNRMDILGDRKFVEVPGTTMHELPPLLVRMSAQVRRLDRVMDMASQLIEQEDMIPPQPAGPATDSEIERRRMDLAVNLVDQYLAFVQHWQWGDSILEWIRQCETTFDTRVDLRNLLRADLWPHAGRSSFVMLLEDKSVETGGVGIEKAMGMRLTFREPPPLLFYLNSTVATTAYQTWSQMSPSPISSLPPERFQFQVLDMNLE
jgi:hypothetical protein